MDYMGIQELYDVSLRATFPITINGKTYQTNEPIIKFQNIQMAPLTESKSRVRARGGYGNAELITWEKTNEVRFSMSEGVISKVGLALLSNSKLEKNSDNEIAIVPFCEEKETNLEGMVELKYIPRNDDTLFIYNKENGERKTDYRIEENKVIISNSSYEDIIIEYTFEYMNNFSILSIGNRLINGYLKLDGKMRLKDDFDGHIKTGIVEIPQVKLMSDLSMRFGRDALPKVYTFEIAGIPTGERENQYVCKIIMLDNEIDSDL